MNPNKKTILYILFSLAILVLLATALLIIGEDDPKQLIPEKDRSFKQRQEYQIKKLQKEEKKHSNIEQSIVPAEAMQLQREVVAEPKKEAIQELSKKEKLQREKDLKLINLEQKCFQESTGDGLTHSSAREFFTELVQNYEQIKNDVMWQGYFHGEVMNISNIPDDILKKAATHFTNNNCKNLYTALQKARLLSGRANEYEIAQECINHPYLIKDDPRELLQIPGDNTYLISYLEYYHANMDLAEVSERFELFYFKERKKLIPYLLQESKITEELDDSSYNEQYEITNDELIENILLNSNKTFHSVTFFELEQLESNELEFIKDKGIHTRTSAMIEALLDPNYKKLKELDENQDPFNLQQQLIARYPILIENDEFQIQKHDGIQNSKEILAAIKSQLEMSKDEETNDYTINRLLQNTHHALNIEDLKSLRKEYDIETIYFGSLKERMQGEQNSIKKQALQDFIIQELKAVDNHMALSEVVGNYIGPFSLTENKEIQTLYLQESIRYVNENPDTYKVNDLLNYSYRLLNEDLHQKLRQHIISTSQENNTSTQ